MTPDQAVLEAVEKALDAIFRREGGFVDNPADPGGATNFGITIGKLREWRKADVTVDDVKALTRAEARAIYRQDYYEKPGYTAITDPRLLGLVLDCAVLHGPGKATRLLQEGLGVAQDGALGPKTRAALADAEPQLYYRVTAARLRFFGRMISGNLTDADRDGIPDNTEFAAGWLNRVAEFVEG